MFKHAGLISLPLIVLAGLRRCPQMHVPCMGCDAVADQIPNVLVLGSIVALAAVVLLGLYRRQVAAKA